MPTGDTQAHVPTPNPAADRPARGTPAPVSTPSPAGDRPAPAPAGPSGDTPAEVPGREETRRRRGVAAAGLADPPGPDDLAVVDAGLVDPEPAVRATALGALARLGRLGLDELRAGATDPSPIVRARAAELAPAVQPVPASAVDLLISLLVQPNESPSVIDSASFGLGELGPAAAGTPSVAALVAVAGTHRDPLCRESAVAALGAIGDPAGLDAILAAASDKPAVRRRAVLALAAFEGPAVESALETALGDRDWQVRQAAEDLTGRRS